MGQCSIHDLFPAGDDNVNPSMWIGNISSLQKGFVRPRTGGQPNILTIDATNGVSCLSDMFETS